ncbi:MAG: PEP-CTERM sorting domain-containing protein [Pirellulales bacterium]
MKQTSRRLLAIGTLLVFFGSPPTQAALVSYNFAGAITTASDPLASFGIVTGDPFTGSFTYDTSLGIVSSGPGNVLYEQPAPIAPLTFSVTVNGVQYAAANSSAPLRIQVTDNSGGLNDQFVVHTVYTGSLVHPLSGSYPFSNMALSLRDSSATIFSSTAIPSSLDLNDFDLVGFSLNLSQNLGDPASETLFLGTITSLTAVPEPGSLMLMLTAISLIRLSRRRWLSTPGRLSA